MMHNAHDERRRRPRVVLLLYFSCERSIVLLAADLGELSAYRARNGPLDFRYEFRGIGQTIAHAVHEDNRQCELGNMLLKSEVAIDSNENVELGLSKRQ